MTRGKKLNLNIVSSLSYQIAATICGFILPRFFLLYFGSKVNGLVSSITYFLGFITLAECGVGAVVQSALYKPLAEHDSVGISKIYLSSERFFKKIAIILLGYVSILMIVYPFIVLDSFDFLFTLTLVLVISVSTFAQYYLGMTYKLLLNADQLGFIQNVVSTFVIIANTLSCVILMQHGASVQVVKLTTSLIFLLQPITFSVIAKRRYQINRNIALTEEPIKQKWNGLAQHISSVVLGNTDIVVLTLLSTLENVSVYTVYHLVLNGVKQIMTSMTNGLRALFGNMLAKNETLALTDAFDCTEWLFHTLVTFIFSLTAFLIVPFVEVYTNEITDTNYISPMFAYLLTLAEAFYCLRLPYYILVNAAGHYKQTQWSAIIEAIINIVVSVVLVWKWSLIGVAIGTVVAMAYRTIYLINYLRKNILFRKISYFLKHLVVDVVEIVLFLLIIKTIPSFFIMQAKDYLSWIVLALKMAVTEGAIILLVNVIMYRSNFQYLFRFLKKL